MIKKISIIILVTILVTACGKKGDPIYNEGNQNTYANNKHTSILRIKVNTCNHKDSLNTSECSMTS